MAEIDLVPGEYRTRQQLRYRLRWVSYIAAALVVSILAGVGLLRHENAALEEALRKLQHAKAITNQQRTQLLDLNQRREEMTQRYDLLNGLRGGTEAVGMLRSIDRAMADSKVWFTDWSFRRAGNMAEVPPNKGKLTANYFIVVPKSPASAQSKAWMIETQMKIDGEAMDHAALSNFVSRLIEQPEIQSVRVLRTEAFMQQQRPLIRYSLDVVVAWPRQEASA